MLGNCVTLYKLQNRQLFADKMSRGSESLNFSNTPLPAEFYAIASPLAETFPQSLLDNEKRTYGAPDTYDQGTIYLIRHTKDDTDPWYIDTNEAILPDFLVPYLQEISHVTDSLRNLHN